MTPFPPPHIDGNQFSVVPPLYSFAHNCFPSSPSENPVINQSLLILPPLLYWRESIFYSPNFILFCPKLPPPLPLKTMSYTKILRPPSPKAISYDSCLTPKFISPNVLHQNRMKTMKRLKIHHPIVYIILRQEMKIQNAVSIRMAIS